MAAHGHRFTAKEHRQVEHIAESERKHGHPAAEAEQIGYATVNKAVEGDPVRRYTDKERRQAEHIIDKKPVPAVVSRSESVV
jgi:hypothetical protein